MVVAKWWLRDDRVMIVLLWRRKNEPRPKIEYKFFNIFRFFRAEFRQY